MSHIGRRLVNVGSSRATLFANQTRSVRPRWSARHLHSRTELPYPLEGGLGEFLPPAALRTVAVDFQEGLLNSLNDELSAHPSVAGKGLVDTIVNTATSRETALAFNYASLALNNDFFLQNLKPLSDASNHENQIDRNLGGAIRKDWGQLDELKNSFSGAVMGMSTSGFVWFVCDKNGGTAILPTFGAGTLLIRARTHMHNGLTVPDKASSPHPRSPPPPPTPTSPLSGLSHSSDPRSPSLTRALHASSPSKLDITPKTIFTTTAAYNYTPKADLFKAGDVLYPLFCVSVHEHAWMSAGYGVMGKREWMTKFWSVLDWEKVSKAFNGHIPPGSID